MTQSPVNDYAQQIKGKTGIRRIINACGYSLAGFRAACSEAAFRQLLWLNGVLLILVLVLDLGVSSRMMLVMASALSLIVELFNTALEAAVDYTSTEYHPLAKRAKDVASAAQMIVLILLAILWLLALCYDWH
ncbi:diacylglycerol kinase [Stenoxybacter acetivorans]|uniref:diacylglycerol kinase n=1 Tax=Stenoxybacter acetivorans TaxID=422441 RepID=UPI00055C1BC6|nr:diacylglycerol kinase [Stenoxybacter acetivorans]